MSVGMHGLQEATRNGQRNDQRDGGGTVTARAVPVVSPWFLRPQPRPDAALRLFCFSHAGGAASAFFQWAAQLPDVDVVSIQLPGREARLSEPLINDACLMVASITREITPLLDRPFVFFGHSMGSYLAFETARSLRRAGLPQPARLILSGRRAPGLAETEEPLHRLPDSELAHELNRRFGGLPAIILAEPDLMAMYLPIIRADVQLLETAEFVEEPPLAMPFTVYGGRDDVRASREMLQSWAALTRGLTDVQMFDGGHFYLHDQRDRFLPELRALLARQIAAISTGTSTSATGTAL